MKLLCTLLLAGCCLLPAGAAETVDESPPECCPGAGVTPSASSFRVAVEKTSTRVLVANVHLEIGDLVQDGDALVGTYSIRVPMKTSKNEDGRMRLPLNAPVERYMHEGGTLEGTGACEADPEPRGIVCKVIPESAGADHGALELTVTTGDRVLKFETSYRIVTPPKARFEVAVSE